MNYELIAKALFEEYESLYDIMVDTGKYRIFYESEDYRKLKLEKSGENFFADLKEHIFEIIAEEDRAYVYGMLSKNKLLKSLNENKYYSFVYRIKQGNKEIYHQLRATLQELEDGKHIFMGVTNQDSVMRREIAHRDEIQALRQKENNHMQAVLASAAAYMEANLSKDELIEKSDDLRDEDKKFVKDIPPASRISRYSRMHEWISENLVTDNYEKYREIGSIEYLLKCYERGEIRTSVPFSIFTKDGGVLPCREVFFLYKEEKTGDIHSFCVIYDLTEQQRQELEKEALERELSLSRLRNFTSQMQPHFLYNALGSIQEVILMNPEYASDLLGDFTIHLRSCIRSMINDNAILFDQELENIKAYVNIEKMRFGDKLKTEFDLETTRFPILPLTVQPIVENAIRHGVYGRGSEGGTVYIRTRNGKRSWIIEVEDNGVGFDISNYEERQKSGKEDRAGIKNTRLRLEKIMDAKVNIESEVGKGTKVTIEIPKEVGANESHYS